MSTILSVMQVNPWAQIAERSKAQFDAALVRYDGWFLVLIAVLFTFGVVLIAAMAAWCYWVKGGEFTGGWSYKDWGVSVWVNCR
jgi:hypothetical protein